MVGEAFTASADGDIDRNHKHPRKHSFRVHRESLQKLELEFIRKDLCQNALRSYRSITTTESVVGEAFTASSVLQ